MNGYHYFRGRTGRIVAVVLALLLTACAGRDRVDGGASREASEAAASGEPIPLRVEVPAISLAYLDLFVARGAGYFEEEGLDIEWLPNIPNTPQAVQTVVTGDADIAVAGTQGMFASLAANRPVVGIGVSAYTPTVLVVATSEAADQLEEDGITAASPIEDRVEALRGLSIANTGAGGSVEQMMRAALADFDLEPSADNFRAFSDQGAAVAAFRENQVPILVASPPASTQPVAEGRGEILISGPEGEVPSWRDSYYLTYITSQGFLDENGPAVEAFLRALVRATNLIDSDIEAAKDAAREYFGEMDEALYSDTVDVLAPAFGRGVMTETGFEGSRTLYNDGVPPESRVAEDLSFDEAFDTAPLEAAIEEVGS